MRAPVPSSSWLNRTSRDFVAETARTGTVTSPKLMVPVQIALGTRGPPCRGRKREEEERVYVRGRLLGSLAYARSVATPSTVEVDGRQLTLTNLEKVLYPATGFTKAGVV